MGKAIRVAAAGLGLIGLFGATTVAQAQVTPTPPLPEDGVAVVEPRAKLSRDGKLKVRLRCIMSSTDVPCSGNFRLTVEDKDWAFAKGSFSDIGAGKRTFVTVSVTPKARRYMRKRCSAKTRAAVTPIKLNKGGTAAEVFQPAVKVSRNSVDC